MTRCGSKLRMPCGHFQTGARLLSMNFVFKNIVLLVRCYLIAYSDITYGKYKKPFLNGEVEKIALKDFFIY